MAIILFGGLMELESAYLFEMQLSKYLQFGLYLLSSVQKPSKPFGKNSKIYFYVIWHMENRKLWKVVERIFKFLFLSHSIS